MDDERRLAWLAKGLAVAFLYVLLAAPRTWVGPRYFPLIPLLPGTPALPFPLDWLLFTVLVLALAAVVFAKRPEKPIVVALACITAGVLMDVNRLQPWTYQYFFMFLTVAAGLFLKRRGRPDAVAAALRTCLAVVAAMFFWSGVEKINVRFFVDVVPWLLQPFSRWLGGAEWPLAMMLGLAIPLIEVAIGAGLLTRKWRVPAAIGGMAVMAIMYVYLGPYGRAWNGTVWSWDMTMIFFLVVLGIMARRDSAKTSFVGVPSVMKLVIALFGIMPALGVLGLWDSNLSAALYSGNTKRAYFDISDSTAERLPPRLAELTVALEPGRRKLSLETWPIVEISAQPYPQDRVYDAIGRAVCRRLGPSADIELVVRGRPGIFDGRFPVARKRCGTL